MLFTKLFFSLCLVSVVVGFHPPSSTTHLQEQSRTRGGALGPTEAIKFASPRGGAVPLALATINVREPSSLSPEKEWTPKRMHNTNWFRSGAILLALALMGASQSSPIARLPTQAGAVLHLLAFSTWFGTMVYTTFIFGITAFRNLPRQTFGKLQAKLFPKYFLLGSICLVLQILTLRSLSLSFLSNKRVAWSLGSALAATLFNQFYMEPYTTKIMLERYDLENSEGGTDTDRYKELRKQFGKMHGMSSLTNLIALCGTIAYGLVLSSLLVAV
mmetsp:Transcript_27404/g.76930  ORF Transcript_27404/g.76930 Transcript_27404/m.76930 type:complete len:273 (-) Transcript_27404:44-862(-)